MSLGLGWRHVTAQRFVLQVTCLNPVGNLRCNSRPETSARESRRISAYSSTFDWRGGNGFSYLGELADDGHRPRGDEPLWGTRRKPLRPLTYTALRAVLGRINDLLLVAWARVRGNKGARTAGVDGIAPRSIGLGAEEMLKRLRSDLKSNLFVPQRVREKAIPKAVGEIRHLGIPTTVDRVLAGQPASLREARNRGQLTVAELVDRYPIGGCRRSRCSRRSRSRVRGGSSTFCGRVVRSASDGLRSDRIGHAPNIAALASPS